MVALRRLHVNYVGYDKTFARLAGPLKVMLGDSAEDAYSTLPLARVVSMMPQLRVVELYTNPDMLWDVKPLLASLPSDSLTELELRGLVAHPCVLRPVARHLAHGLKSAGLRRLALGGEPKEWHWQVWASLSGTTLGEISQEALGQQRKRASKLGPGEKADLRDARLELERHVKKRSLTCVPRF